jgi:hypothetical protein
MLKRVDHVWAVGSSKEGEENKKKKEELKVKRKSSLCNRP